MTAPHSADLARHGRYHILERPHHNLKPVRDLLVGGLQPPHAATLGLQVGFLLGGTILVEIIFSWGGIGMYAWVGIFRLDMPVIMGVTLATTLAFMLVNLAVDLLYAVFNPRISYA